MLRWFLLSKKLPTIYFLQLQKQNCSNTMPKKHEGFLPIIRRKGLIIFQRENNEEKRPKKLDQKVHLNNSNSFSGDFKYE